VSAASRNERTAECSALVEQPGVADQRRFAGGQERQEGPVEPYRGQRLDRERIMLMVVEQEAAAGRVGGGADPVAGEVNDRMRRQQVDNGLPGGCLVAAGQEGRARPAIADQPALLGGIPQDTPNPWRGRHRDDQRGPGNRRLRPRVAERLDGRRVRRDDPVDHGPAGALPVMAGSMQR
jgi:hypothetical protein